VKESPKSVQDSSSVVTLSDLATGLRNRLFCGGSYRRGQERLCRRPRTLLDQWQNTWSRSENSTENRRTSKAVETTGREGGAGWGTSSPIWGQEGAFRDNQRRFTLLSFLLCLYVIIFRVTSFIRIYKELCFGLSYLNFIYIYTYECFHNNCVSFITSHLVIIYSYY